MHPHDPDRPSVRVELAIVKVYPAPRSTCECGHLGDHLGDEGGEHADGYGPCTHPGCDCTGYRFKIWVEPLQKLLAIAARRGREVGRR